MIRLKFCDVDTYADTQQIRRGNSHSESSLAQLELISVPFGGAKRLQVGEFLGLDHLNAITFLVHEHSSLLAIYQLSVPLNLPMLLIFVHLSSQVGLVVIEHVASLCLHGFLLFL